MTLPFDRITIEAGKMGGQPCIRGMRIAVRRVLDILATNATRTELFEEFPELQKKDLRQALAFAAAGFSANSRSERRRPDR